MDNKSDSFEVTGPGTLQGDITGKPVTLPQTVTKIVARVGDKTYPSISDALKENPAGTVVLVADVTENVVIAGNMSVTLDLAGHTLTNAGNHTITNNGNLTVSIRPRARPAWSITSRMAGPLSITTRGRPRP